MTKRLKLRYTEEEAARKLGVTVEQLRAIAARVVRIAPNAAAGSEYSAADLIVMKYYREHPGL
jgi:hypothetical protein